MLLMIDGSDSFHLRRRCRSSAKLGEERRGRAQRRRFDLAGLRCLAARPYRRLTRAVHAERSRRLGAADPGIRRRGADPRRLPRPGRSIGRPSAEHRSRQGTDPRQTSIDATPTPACSAPARSLPHATRYHSLVIEHDRCRIAWHHRIRTNDSEIMGVRHETLMVEGVQIPPRVHPHRARPRHAWPNF